MKSFLCPAARKPERDFIRLSADSVKCACRRARQALRISQLLRLWWNWQTRYFEVVVGQPVQVQVLLSAPIYSSHYQVLTDSSRFRSCFLAQF
jgi:hypothetical protein